MNKKISEFYSDVKILRVYNGKEDYDNGIRIFSAKRGEIGITIDRTKLEKIKE